MKHRNLRRLPGPGEYVDGMGRLRTHKNRVDPKIVAEKKQDVDAVRVIRIHPGMDMRLTRKRPR